MAESKRDPSVGLDWLAWWAIQGDEDPAFIGEYLEYAQRRLGEIEAADPSRASDDLTGLRIVLLAILEAMQPDGDTYLQVKFSHRKGRVNKLERAKLGRKAAVLALRREREDGDPTEAAVAFATEQTGLSRSEVYKWRRTWLDEEEYFQRRLC